jgi:hypothetical protein
MTPTFSIVMVKILQVGKGRGRDGARRRAGHCQRLYFTLASVLRERRGESSHAARDVTAAAAS